MMWEEEKWEWCWGTPCQSCKDRKVAVFLG